MTGPPYLTTTFVEYEALDAERCNNDPSSNTLVSYGCKDVTHPSFGSQIFQMTERTDWPADNIVGKNYIYTQDIDCENGLTPDSSEVKYDLADSAGETVSVCSNTSD